MSKRSAISLGIELLLVLAFAVSYTQRPLYHSNQNHRFVHGFAHAGFGYLRDDWLANTADPTPLFSLLVQATCRWGVPALFYLWYLAIMYVYVHSLSRIARTFLGPKWLQLQLLVFAALFVLVHSLLLDDLVRQSGARDVGNFLHAGVAMQDVLGPMFQPSVVGVFLILSVDLFLAGKPYAAVCASSLAATLHSTYLVSAAVLTLAYAFALVLERRHRLAAGVALISLLTVLPVVIYNAVMFRPSSAETFAAGNAIMAHWRFPHHTELTRWINVSAGLKLLLIILAIAWTGDRPLGLILTVSLLASLALTLLQDALDSDALALLFPWRTSVWLVPLATSVVLARGVELLFRASVWARPLVRRGVAAGAVIVILMCVAYGVQQMAAWHAAPQKEAGLFAFVRSELQRGQVWLIPIHLQTFRLRTGAPILVDYKSHPYKDVEVLEWKRRMDAATACYADLEGNGHTAIEEVCNRYGITHVVSEQPLGAAAGELVYNDPSFWVYRLR